MILKRGRGSAPWEGTQPLTGQAIIDFFNPDKKAKAVSETQAFSLAPVYRASGLISSAVAGADKYIMKADGTVKPGFNILDTPNTMIDPYAFWEYAAMSIMFHGNFYAIIGRRGGVGAIESLSPLPPQIVKPKAVVSNGRILDIIYEVRFKGDEDPVGVPADEMFHIKGKGGDWLAGCSIIEHAQRVFSNAVMTDQYAESFYGNGSLLSGVLKTDKRLDEKTAGALKNRWRQKVQGIDNAFDIVVLDSGTDFQPITVNPQDAQFLEARRFNVEEIARMFGVPKELLGENGAAPIDPEKAGILFVTFTLSDWKKRIESAASRQILGSSHSASLQFTDLVVADERTRSSAAVMWRTAQILSINELRVREGLPPIEESDADDPMYVAEGKDATTPGTNQGKQEQPVPADQAPADQPLGDNNA